ncbi:MAG TPA: hypothetical protein VMR86_07285 [Myxococcota bacterium]|nr:hypothetical protein [Myxococcota bacterium]
MRKLCLVGLLCLLGGGQAPGSVSPGGARPALAGRCGDAWLEADAGRSGCCSHHQGVCGCKNGHALCCDGVQSPTCGCD